MPSLRTIWIDTTRRKVWQEVKWRGKVYKALSRQYVAAASEYRRTGRVSDETFVKHSIGNVIFQMDKDVAVREATGSYREVMSMITKRASLGFDKEFAQAIVDYLQEHFLETVTDMDQYTKDIILKIIADGVAQGYGQDKIVEMIMEARVLARPRAARITRTEVNRAANAGRVIGAKKTGLLLKKVWSSAPQPNRTRGGKPQDKADHLHMNAQKVDMDQQFIDPRNGALLDQPGDPKAPPVCTVNCRCAVAFEPQKDMFGNYIRVEKPIYETVFN